MEIGEPNMNRAAACTLCAEISGSAGTNLYRQLKSDGLPESRILAESSGFIAMPSLGHLVDGYMILCSRDHVPSIGASLHHRPIEELVEFVADVRGRIERLFGRDIVLFEHGCGRNSPQLGCGIYHAHLHMIPSTLDFGIDGRVSQLRWNPCTLQDLQELGDSPSGYLFYTNPLGKGFATTDTSSVPSQFFRRIIADAVLKSTQWNWREFPMADRIASTMHSFSAGTIG
jgi:hypothetical protein